VAQKKRAGKITRLNKRVHAKNVGNGKSSSASKKVRKSKKIAKLITTPEKEKSQEKRGHKLGQEGKRRKLTCTLSSRQKGGGGKGHNDKVGEKNRFAFRSRRKVARRKIQRRGRSGGTESVPGTGRQKVKKSLIFYLHKGKRGGSGPLGKAKGGHRSHETKKKKNR